MIAPVLETIAEDYADSLKIAKLDIDHNLNTTNTYGVQSIPTLILFKDGQEVERLIGYMPKAASVRTSWALPPFSHCGLGAHSSVGHSTGGRLPSHASCLLCARASGAPSMDR
jgi:hypothetical protein